MKPVDNAENAPFSEDIVSSIAPRNGENAENSKSAENFGAPKTSVDSEETKTSIAPQIAPNLEDVEFSIAPQNEKNTGDRISEGCSDGSDGSCGSGDIPVLSEGKRARLIRQIALIGEEATARLAGASVAVIGLGGVGGYVSEMLARMGVGKLCLVDCDVVSESNINRQVIALMSTVGRKKTEVMLERVKDIAPDCDVTVKDVFVTKENADALIAETGCDIIVDAIDNVSAKVALIISAKARGKYVFSVMGAGNKTDPDAFRVADISKTHTCGLAKAVRKCLRDAGVEGVDVLFSTEPPTKVGERTPASIAFMPPIAGIKTAEHIFRKIAFENITR